MATPTGPEPEVEHLLRNVSFEPLSFAGSPLPAPVLRRYRLVVCVCAALAFVYGLVSLIATATVYSHFRLGPWHLTGWSAGLALMLIAWAAWREPHADARAAAWAALGLTLAASGWIEYGRWFHGPSGAEPPTLLVALTLALVLGPRKRVLNSTLVLALGLIAITAVSDLWMGTPLRTISGPRDLNPALMVAMLAACVAWLASDPHHRPASLLLEPGSTGWMVRRLIPLVVAFPVLIAWIRTQRHAHHPVETWVVGLAYVLGSFVIFLTLLWKAASALDRLDVSREDLRAYANEFSDLYQHAPCGYHSLDAEGRFVNINDTELGWLGYRRSEVVGRMAFADLLSPESRAAFERHYPALQDGSPCSDLELELVRRDGSRLPVVVSETAIRDLKGNFLRTRSSVFDATQRKAAEAALRDSEERLRHLLDSTGEGIVALDLEGHCTLCNPAALRLLGFAHADELLGRDVHALTHHSYPDGRPYPREDCRLLLAARRGAGVEFDEEVFWRPDGTAFPVEYRSYPIRRDGHTVGLVVTFTDITARRSLEQQIRQSQKMEGIGRLAAGVAHDFNNLLTVINGYSEMMLAMPLPAELAEPAKAVRQAGERAAILTQQLLAFSRKQTLQPQILDLNQRIEAMVPWLGRTLGEDVEVRVEAAPALWAVRADPSQMDQVVMNLVLNARDAIPAGQAGDIRIRTANLDVTAAEADPELPAGAYVQLEIQDNGTGMTAEIQAHIFEPFFTTKPLGKGTGLGLPTVFGIARQSGGTVRVSSLPGRGTTMQVFLPALATTVPTEIRPVATTRPTTISATQGQGETVLVVEDEAGLRRMLSCLLKERGYNPMDAGGPEDAVRLSREHAGAIQLLITDVVMPSMNGPTLAAQLQSERPDMRVMFISGYADQVLPAGAFLKKPFTPEALTRKIREVLNEDSTAAAMATMES